MKFDPIVLQLVQFAKTVDSSFTTTQTPLLLHHLQSQRVRLANGFSVNANLLNLDLAVNFQK